MIAARRGTLTMSPHRWLLDETYRLDGFGFRVRSDMPDAPEAFDRLLGPIRCAGPVDAEYSLAVEPRGAAPYALYFGDRMIQVAGSGAWMFDRVMADVTERALFENAKVVALHAGAVSLDGMGVVLPATAGSGKSTLTCALVIDGFDLLSDEAALIDPLDGAVKPFLRPIALERPSFDVLPGIFERLPEAYRSFRSGRIYLGADDLRAGCVGRPSGVAHIVFPRYEAGATTELVPVGRAEALAEMITGCFNRRTFGPRSVEILARVVRDATCHRLLIGDLSSAVRAVRSLIR
jgi:hypothetical protein